MKKTLLRNITSTTVISGSSRAVIFVIPIVISIYFGVSKATDSFFFIYALIFYIVTTFSTVIRPTIVPYFSNEENDASNAVNSILFYSLSFFLFLFVLMFFSLSGLLEALTHFDDNQITLIRTMFPLMYPLTFFAVNSSVLAALLDSKKLFWINPVSQFAYGFCVILGMLIFHNHFSVLSIVVGYTFGSLVRYIMLFVFSKKYIHYRFEYRFTDQFKAYLKKSLYYLVGMFLLSIYPLLDRFFASTLETGSLTILDYADKFYRIPIILATDGLIVVMLSYWSNDSAKSEFKSSSVGKTVFNSFKVLLVLSLLYSAAAFFFIKIFYSNFGSVEAHYIQKIRELFLIMMLGYIPAILHMLYTRWMMVEGLTKTLMYLCIYKLILKCIFNVIFVRFFDVYGIALSTAAINYLSLSFVWYVYYKKTRQGLNKT